MLVDTAKESSPQTDEMIGYEKRRVVRPSLCARGGGPRLDQHFERRVRRVSTSSGHPAKAPLREGRVSVPIGPVQLIVLGSCHPEFHGGVVALLQRLHDDETVRVIDALAVDKDAEGKIEVEHLGNLSREQAIEVGSTVGALVGLGIEGEAGAEAGADGVRVSSDEKTWDVIEEIPNDSAAALVLLEHHWAVPLRDVIARAGGFGISDGFVSPLDLVEVGLMSADEAQALHAADSLTTVR